MTDTINLQYTTIKDPLPDFVYEGLARFSSGANTYRPQPTELIEKLAIRHNLPSEMIFLTAGIDEAIQLFAKTYGQNAFVFTPTYIVYSDVEEFGGKLTRTYSIEGAEFKARTANIPGATLIFLANPNNPSGVTGRDEVMTLVGNNPEAMVVIDEAYGEFANLSVLDQVKNHPNMAVFRSFSKGYGMAGNRVGFVVADPTVITNIKRKAQWANVSYLSVGAASIALDHEEYFAAMRKVIGLRRDKFMNFLRRGGFTLLPSQINAVVIKFQTEEKANAFTNYLTENNFVISQGNGNSNMGLDKSFVRIAIGTEEQMAVLKKVISEFTSRAN